MKQKYPIVSTELIASKIYIIRGLRVMLDRDLAQLYDVQTKVLKQAVNRNKNRFPEDFMFVLSTDEYTILRSQFVTSSSSGWGGSRYAPMVFTEQGVAMLSSVLNSGRAIEVNIRIIRVFTRLRQMLHDNNDLRRELDEMKRTTNDRFQIVFETLDQLLNVAEQPKRKIGFTAKDHRASYAAKRRMQSR